MKGATARFGLSGSKKKGNFAKSISNKRVNKIICKKSAKKKEKRDAQKARNTKVRELQA